MFKFDTYRHDQADLAAAPSLMRCKCKHCAADIPEGRLLPASAFYRAKKRPAHQRGGWSAQCRLGMKDAAAHRWRVSHARWLESERQHLLVELLAHLARPKRAQRVLPPQTSE